MLDPHTKQQIEIISYELLKSSKALDQFPTPVDDIVTHASLVVEMGIDLSKVKTSFFSKFTDDISRFLSKIRGMLDRKEKIIYLDLSQSSTRQHFVKLHEAGHHLLPWQKAVLDCLDDDNTLNPYIDEQFEEEANYFATITLFQIDRFQDQMKKLELSIGSAMHLAKVFGASNHAAFRRYVECSKLRCALLILEKHELAGNSALYKARDYFQSEKFTQDFGKISMPEQFGYAWDFVRDYYFKRKIRTDGKVSFTTESGEVDFEYHFFNSTYNGFVLIFPLGEKKISNTKIILTNGKTAF